MATSDVRRRSEGEELELPPRPRVVALCCSPVSSDVQAIRLISAMKSRRRRRKKKEEERRRRRRKKKNKKNKNKQKKQKKKK